MKSPLAAGVAGVVFCAVVVGAYSNVHGALKQASAITAPSEPKAVIDRYCVSCHNGKLKTAGLALDELDLNRVGSNAEVWEKIATKFRTHEMPPPGRTARPTMPRPSTLRRRSTRP